VKLTALAVLLRVVTVALLVRIDDRDHSAVLATFAQIVRADLQSEWCGLRLRVLVAG